VTARVRELDAEVHLGPADGMPEDCVVNLDNLATIRRSLLRARVTTLDRTRMAQVERAIHLALAITLPCSAK
jgi:mRNA-degrading endonuclease toxin of MazEF toxin-antitoxin module